MEKLLTGVAWLWKETYGENNSFKALNNPTEKNTWKDLIIWHKEWGNPHHDSDDC